MNKLRIGVGYVTISIRHWLVGVVLSNLTMGVVRPYSLINLRIGVFVSIREQWVGGRKLD